MSLAGLLAVLLSWRLHLAVTGLHRQLYFEVECYNSFRESLRVREGMVIAPTVRPGGNRK